MSRRGGSGNARRAGFRGLAGILNVLPGIPTISGTVSIGNALTITPNAQPGVPAGTYVLCRDGVSAGAVVSGYTFESADVGRSLTVRATNAAGTSGDSNALTWAMPSGLKRQHNENGQTVATGVSSWVDQAPVPGTALTQATGTKQPPQITVASKSVPNGDGVYDVLMCADALSTMITNSAQHVFAVVQPLAVSQTNANPLLCATIVSATGGFWGLAIRKNGANYEATAIIDDGGQKIITATGLALDAPNLIEWGHTGGNQTMRVNANAAVTPVATGNVGSLTGTIRVFANYLTQQWLDGAICELLVFNVTLSATDTADVRAYLGNRWGVLSGSAARAITALVAGDSIAIGYQSLAGGWRLKLKGALATAAFDYQEVGPYTTGGGRHDAVSGQKARDVTDLQAQITAYQPDAIVLAWGSNDAGAGDSAATIESNLSSRITDAKTARKSASVPIFVLSIPPRTGFQTVVDTVNADMPAICASASVAWVDIDAPAESDGVHPTEAGYAAMVPPVAAAWQAAFP